MYSKIYTLSCPITNDIKYVGVTKQPLNIRFNEHIYSCKRKGKKSIKQLWIQSLIDKNLYPKIELLDVVHESDSLYFESFYVELFESWGLKLKNSKNYTFTSDYIRKIKSGIKLCDEHKSKISNGLNKHYSNNPSKNIGRKRNKLKNNNI